MQKVLQNEYVAVKRKQIDNPEYINKNSEKQLEQLIEENEQTNEQTQV